MENNEDDFQFAMTGTQPWVGVGLKRGREVDDTSGVTFAGKVRKLEEEAKKELCDRVIHVVDREMLRAISDKTSEIEEIDLRILRLQQCLHTLRYCVSLNYYAATKTMGATYGAESAPAVHPSVRKHLGKAPLKKNYKERPILESKDPPDSSLTKIYSFQDNKSNQDSSQSLYHENPTVGETKVKVIEEVDKQESTGNAGLSRPPSPKALPPKVPDKLLKISQGRKEKFQSKKRLVVGNTYQYLKDQDNAAMRYKWQVYVRGPSHEDDITTFISSVTFILDKSYAPHDVITIRRPPFILSRRGWGEFKIRIKLKFVEKRNKSVNLLHPLTLTRMDDQLALTGLWRLGQEKWYDIWVFEPHQELSAAEDQNVQNCDSAQETSISSNISKELEKGHVAANIDGNVTISHASDSSSEQISKNEVKLHKDNVYIKEEPKESSAANDSEQCNPIETCKNNTDPDKSPSSYLNKCSENDKHIDCRTDSEVQNSKQLTSTTISSANGQQQQMCKVYVRQADGKLVPDYIPAHLYPVALKIAHNGLDSKIGKSVSSSGSQILKTVQLKLSTTHKQREVAQVRKQELLTNRVVGDLCKTQESATVVTSGGSNNESVSEVGNVGSKTRVVVKDCRRLVPEGGASKGLQHSVTRISKEALQALLSGNKPSTKAPNSNILQQLQLTQSKLFTIQAAKKLEGENKKIEITNISTNEKISNSEAASDGDSGNVGNSKSDGASSSGSCGVKEVKDTNESKIGITANDIRGKASTLAKQNIQFIPYRILQDTGGSVTKLQLLPSCSSKGIGQTKFKLSRSPGGQQQNVSSLKVSSLENISVPAQGLKTVTAGASGIALKGMGTLGSGQSLVLLPSGQLVLKQGEGAKEAGEKTNISNMLGFTKAKISSSDCNAQVIRSIINKADVSSEVNQQIPAKANTTAVVANLSDSWSTPALSLPSTSKDLSTVLAPGSTSLTVDNSAQILLNTTTAKSSLPILSDNGQKGTALATSLESSPVVVQSPSAQTLVVQGTQGLVRTSLLHGSTTGLRGSTSITSLLPSISSSFVTPKAITSLGPSNTNRSVVAALVTKNKLTVKDEDDSQENLSKLWEAKIRTMRQICKRSASSEGCVKLWLKFYPLTMETASSWLKEQPPSNITCLLPFCAQSREVFLSWSLAKQRACEYQRARYVVRELKSLGCKELESWTTKHVVAWARRHAYTPITPRSRLRTDDILLGNRKPRDTDWSSLTLADQLYSSVLQSDNSLTITSAEDYEVDVITLQEEATNVKCTQAESPQRNKVVIVPAEDTDQEQGITWVSNILTQMRLRLKPEIVLPGYSFNLAHALLWQACLSLMEDLLRTCHDSAWYEADEVPPTYIGPAQIAAALSDGRKSFSLLDNTGLGAPQIHTQQS